MASAGSYHKLPEPDDLLECPYDKAHVIRFKKLPYHLLKCRMNHPVTYESCPFDARHQVPKPELSIHIETCPQRALVERDVAHALQHRDGLEEGSFKAETNVPPYDAWQPPEPEEDWEADISQDAAASCVTWTAPVRDRQWLTVDKTLPSNMQQLSVAEKLSIAAVKQEAVQQELRQPSQHELQQNQPWQPPAGPQLQKPQISPPSSVQQQPLQAAWGWSTQQELRLMSQGGNKQQQQQQSNFPQLPQVNLQPVNPNHLISQLPRPVTQQAGRGRGTRPLAIVDRADNLVSPGNAAKEPINQDPGRSRIAANFQHAGVTSWSGSHVRAPNSSTIDGSDVSAARHDGNTSGAGDPIQQLQLKLKKIVKKLRQISDLEKKDHLDDDQKRKVCEKADLEHERDTIKMELERLGSIQK